MWKCVSIVFIYYHRKYGNVEKRLFIVFIQQLWQCENPKIWKCVLFVLI